MSKKIQLTKGQVAIVDDEDYEWLSQWKWFSVFCVKRFYAARHQHNPDTQKNIRVYMHRLILSKHMQIGKSHIVDHKNGNPLDNRKENLRLCSHAENMQNSRQGANKNKHGYCGISKTANKKPWEAKISASGKRIHLGYFSTKEEAARAYDDGARRYHGEFATLNFPLPHEREA